MKYTNEEVIALLDWWAELRHSDRSFALVRYADLSVALRQMPPVEYRAVLLLGVLGLSTREAAPYEAVSHDTMRRRWESAVAFVVAYLNTGDLT